MEGVEKKYAMQQKVVGSKNMSFFICNIIYYYGWTLSQLSIYYFISLYQHKFITKFSLPEISLTSIKVAFGNFNFSLFLMFSSPGVAVHDVPSPWLLALTRNLSLLRRRKTDAHRKCDCFTAS